MSSASMKNWIPSCSVDAAISSGSSKANPKE